VGIRPELVETRPVAAAGPPDGLDGLLVIGDRCFAIERQLGAGPSPPRAHDLAAWWQGLTGCPFVFAVWVASRAVSSDASRSRTVADLLARARNHGLATLRDIARREAGRGRAGPGGEASEEALYYYFTRCLRYTLGEREWVGMRRFHELGSRHGLVPPARPPEPAV
jgi:predicted solute-binding protein